MPRPFLLIATCLLAVRANPTIPLQLKSNNSLQQGGLCTLKQGSGLCPASTAPFHLVCPEYSFNNATEACQSLGYKQASITDADIPAIVSMLTACAPNDLLWIEAYNGFVRDPCLPLAIPGLAIAGVQTCDTLTGAVLCQDISVVTETLIDTTTSTTSWGVVTETVAAYDPQHCHHPAPNPPPCQHCRDGGPVVLKSGKQAQPCPLVCPVEDGSLRLIQEKVPFAQADALCAVYGWRLADLTAGLLPNALSILAQCTPDNPAAYVRSFDGISAPCAAAFLNGGGVYNFGSGMALSGAAPSGFCTFPLYVFCDASTRPLAYTTVGPWIGTRNFTTQVYSTTVRVNVPTSTRTITSYAADCQHLF